MCVVSMIADDWSRTVPQRYPKVIEFLPALDQTTTGPDQAEFNALKKEVEELKKLLIQAKIYDKATGQADCEKEEKVALLKKIAELVGVDLKEVLLGA